MTTDVAVNMLWCVPGKVGGSEEYLVRQLLGLVDVAAPDWRPTIYALDGFADAHPGLAEVATIETAPFGGTRRVMRVAGEATWLRSRTTPFALVHHGGGTAPPRARRPYVVTVHDLQYRTFPEHFSQIKRAYLDRMIPAAVRAAAVTAVPSQYVRRSVIEAYEVPPDRVVVVPHGIEPALHGEVASPAELRRRYALGSGPVIVYPAVTHTHKNHRFLLEMMRLHWTDPELRLVLIGGTGDAEHIVTACSDPRVCRLGRVAPRDRNGLIAMAEAMVFPSRYEGFGAPLIEAMALGTPVVASDVTCIPEVVGPAGIVVALEPDAWAGTLDEAAARRGELVDAGLSRAAGFTAAASGRALATAYAQAIA